MKNHVATIFVASALTISAIVIMQKAHAQNASSQAMDKTGAMSIDAIGVQTTNQQGVPILVTNMPPGYRDWKLVSVSHEEGYLTDIRAILGNDIAISAYREGKLPFPEGTIIARLAWSYVPSQENDALFFRVLKRDIQHSYVAGPPTNGVQFMIKDTKKYASTGGWGFGQFNDGKPISEAVLKNCFPCHAPTKASDFVFTRNSP